MCHGAENDLLGGVKQLIAHIGDSGIAHWVFVLTIYIFSPYLMRIDAHR